MLKFEARGPVARIQWKAHIKFQQAEQYFSSDIAAGFSKI